MPFDLLLFTYFYIIQSPREDSCRVDSGVQHCEGFWVNFNVVLFATSPSWLQDGCTNSKQHAAILPIPKPSRVGRCFFILMCSFYFIREETFFPEDPHRLPLMIPWSERSRMPTPNYKRSWENECLAILASTLCEELFWLGECVRVAAESAVTMAAAVGNHYP